MAHIKNTSIILLTTFILSGCYTQVKVIEERPSRMLAERYSADSAQPMNDQDIYDMGYEDALRDAELHFRDFDRYRWSTRFHGDFWFSHSPMSSFHFHSYGFAYHHYYDYWGWPNFYWYHSRYHPYRWSVYHRYPVYGWGGPFVYGHPHYVVYNFHNVTGYKPSRVRTTRGSSVSMTGTRADAMVRNVSRSSGMRSTTANRPVTRTSGNTAVTRSTNVTRSTGTSGGVVKIGRAHV